MAQSGRSRSAPSSLIEAPATSRAPHAVGAPIVLCDGRRLTDFTPPIASAEHEHLDQDVADADERRARDEARTDRLLRVHPGGVAA